LWLVQTPFHTFQPPEVAVPRTRSAKKHQRQTKARTAVNRAQRSALRSAVKKVRTAGTAEERQAAFQAAQKLLDRGGRKNVVHRNTAARTKSRLARLLKG
jgi:small subunit ribosomal protein S20